MVPLLKFWFHEEVRRSAVQTLPELLNSAVLCRDKGLHGVDGGVVKQVRGEAAGLSSCSAMHGKERKRKGKGNGKEKKGKERKGKERRRR
jgi:hypothetical protein